VIGEVRPACQRFDQGEGFDPVEMEKGPACFGTEAEPFHDGEFRSATCAVPPRYNNAPNRIITGIGLLGEF
jgi:hypothetical protein